MKKTTILAVSLVLAATFAAVWFALEKSSSEQAGTSLADTQVATPPSTDDLVTEPALQNNRAPIEVVPNSVPAQSAAAAAEDEPGVPAPFLTDTELTGVEFAEASLRAQELFNRYTDQFVQRMRLVTLDHDAYQHVLEAVGSGAKNFDRPFALDIFPDRPCIISSFNHTLGGQSPQDFSIANSTCDNNDSEVWVYKGEGELVFRVLDRDMDLRVARLPGTSAYVAFEVVTFRRNPITTF